MAPGPDTRPTQPREPSDGRQCVHAIMVDPRGTRWSMARRGQPGAAPAGHALEDEPPPVWYDPEARYAPSVAPSGTLPDLPRPAPGDSYGRMRIASSGARRPTPRRGPSVRAWARLVPGRDRHETRRRTDVRVHPCISCQQWVASKPGREKTGPDPIRPDPCAVQAWSSSRSMARRMKRAASALLPPSRSPSSCSSARIRSPR